MLDDADDLIGDPTDPQLATDKLPELSKDTTFDSWINETHQWAIALAYLNGRLKSASWAALEAKQITPDEVPALPASYAAYAVCNEVGRGSEPTGSVGMPVAVRGS